MTAWSGWKRRCEVDDGRQDRGAGYVMATLDHSSGQVRVSMDNVTPEEAVRLAQLLQAYMVDLLVARGRQRREDGAPSS